MTYARYADVETKLFPVLSADFQRTGCIDPVDFLAILTWKANRSRTKHISRFSKNGFSFRQAVEKIADAVFTATSDPDRLRILMSDWGFRLATASAILTVLYPDRFTIYDVRVCGQLNAFEDLKARRFSISLWDHYEKFKKKAIAHAPQGLTLREVDHYHWGNSWHRDALTTINEFDGSEVPVAS